MHTGDPKRKQGRYHQIGCARQMSVFARLCLQLGISITGCSFAYSAPGNIDDAFNPGASAPVLGFLEQTDGKIVLAGPFADVARARRRAIARVDADGTLDKSFNGEVELSLGSTYDSWALQTDGKILVGGSFESTVGGARRNLGRLNPDGTLDVSFNPIVGYKGYSVRCMAIQPDDKIVVGGSFQFVNQSVRNNVARVNPDGSADLLFNPNANSVVTTLAIQGDGKIVIGGVFTTVAGVPRQYLARVNADGSLDLGFNASVDRQVHAVAIQADGKVLIGGEFTTVSEMPRTSLARLNSDGSLDETFTPSVAGRIATIAIQTDGKIVVGSATDPWRSYRLHPDGRTDFEIVADNSVRSAALLKGGEILLGGGFSSLNESDRLCVARVKSDAAMESLQVVSTDRVQWLRSGSAPEAQYVTLELSVDGGSSWVLLGTGTRVPDGWEMAGLALPDAGLVRARARIAGGSSNASNWFVEAVAAFSIPSEISILHEASERTSGQSVTMIAAAGGNGAFETFTIRNDGCAPLTGIAASLEGANLVGFALEVTGMKTSLDPGESTSFTVQFTPTTSNLQTAAVHIASNDLDEDPFVLNLNGRALSFDTDSDDDGVSDAAEWQMAALGFNWQVKQEGLAASFAAGGSDVQAAMYRAQGREEVLSEPNSFGLYTPSQVEALHVGTPLLKRDHESGLFTLTLELKRSENLTTFETFSIAAEQVTITPQGEIQLEFDVPGTAAFFRIEAR